MEYIIFKATWLNDTLVFYQGDQNMKPNIFSLLEQCKQLYSSLLDKDSDYQGCSLKYNDVKMNLGFHDDELLIFTEKHQDKTIMFLVRDLTFSIIFSQSSTRPILQYLLNQLL
eukprot:EST47156.1 Hypothetical protein SS50377_12667 [Spironucleus salmonicida]